VKRARRSAEPRFDVERGWGTSLATAMVVGLAALWLSYHGESTEPGAARDKLAGKVSGKDRIHRAFALHLQQSARVPEGWNTDRYGAGIADGAALLATDLPTLPTPGDKVDEHPHSLLSLSGFLSDLFTRESALPSLSAEERKRLDAVAEALLRTTGSDLSLDLLQELTTLVMTDFRLLSAFLRYEAEESPYLLLDLTVTLYGESSSLSRSLVERLREGRENEEATLRRLHRADPQESAPMRLPEWRPLRVFAADPSLQTSLATAAINTVTVPVLWEEGLRPGPVGEYLEVIDVDPASGCAYAPVDLNDLSVVARNGLTPSEGDPQFHQQMVYAVAMNTISHFERALSRPIFWSSIAPWRRDLPEERGRNTRENMRLNQGGRHTGEEDRTDRFVQRLRIYPHALREANAYYSPVKRALLFGYFPAITQDTGAFLPGGLVFSCLSHDIIAHETTHAILDGMHSYFNESSNEDVLAFHEAFSDIIALFQRFTYADFLRYQIAGSRGDLSAETLLGQLAQEFGLAVGGRQALRSALGDRVVGKDGVKRWQPKVPDPSILYRELEPHYRGAVLVAAVFRAFLIVYNFRTQDLMRLYTGGTGVLPPGQIHPDLVHRLADEAARTAADILAVCIRALDYVPPVDITFGEYLRALVTADYERDRTDPRYRTAFIEAFRAWGIYPRDVRTLSVESLRWRNREDDPTGKPVALNDLMRQFDTVGFRGLRQQLMARIEQWKPGTSREEVFRYCRYAQATLRDALKALIPAQRRREPGEAKTDANTVIDIIPGIDLNDSFSVANLRALRRVLPDGTYQARIVFEVIQTLRGDPLSEWDLPLRGGATVIVNLQTEARDCTVDYVIYKRLYRDTPGRGTNLSERYKRQIEFLQRGVPSLALTGTAAGEGGNDLQTMFDSTCACTKRKHKIALRLRQEQFALLHRGIADDVHLRGAVTESAPAERSERKDADGR
jgi:hypothetical protein